jgi:hypothetical protein
MTYIFFSQLSTKKNCPFALVVLSEFFVANSIVSQIHRTLAWLLDDAMFGTHIRIEGVLECQPP